MASPNYYIINFEREIVFQGNDTAFLTIKRDPAFVPIPGKNLWVYIWVQPQTLNIDNTLENRNLNIPFAGPNKYDIDDNFYINGIKISKFAEKKQKMPTVGGGSNFVNNPTDGQTPKFYNKTSAGNRWMKFPNADDELTYRVDYDGIKDGHVKITFLFYEGINPGNPLRADLNAASFATPLGPQPYFGVKNNHFRFPFVSPAAYLDLLDYQEVHIFGYKESYVRPNREIYQNLYKSVEKPIYDDKSSYALLRTNPKLSGNIKLTVDSVGGTWLNTIDANDELSNSKYKRFPVSTSSTYQKDLLDFAGTIPPQTLFSLYQFDDQYLNTKRELSQQLDNFYTYGAEQLNNKYYDENFSFLAPIWLRKKVPDYFVIMRMSHPVEEESYDETVSQEDQIKRYFEKGNIVKTFDLGETSKVGSYLRRLVNDERFSDRPLEVSFEKDNLTVWNGIDYRKGALAGKGEFLYDFFTADRPIQEFEEFITSGFERNGIISSNLINLEFLFNDEEAKLYSINRYVGFYVDENQLAEIEISGFGLQKNLSQIPAPKPGVDGEPYSNRDFVQSNPDGIVIPVHYYQGTHNQVGAEPEFIGTTTGKLPLAQNVEDLLRIFYVKDREGNFKRIKELNEVTYGEQGTPDSITVSELRLGDTAENIALYGGVNEIVSQFDALLLDSGSSQLIVNLENTQGSSQLLMEEEEIKIVQRKLNQQVRDRIYNVIITAQSLGLVTSLDWSESLSIPQSVSVSYPFVGPAVKDLDAFLRIEFDPAIPYAIGDEWNITIINHEITITNVSGTNGLVAKPIEQYEDFTWRMIANPIGIPIGNAFRYPTYDPNGYDNLSHFNPEGTPSDVAKAIANCINSFENRIVDATPVGGKIILKSKVPYEDGNFVSFIRLMQQDSVINNVTFYESGLVENNVNVTKVMFSPSNQELNETIIKFYKRSKYFSKYFYFYMTTGAIQVRLDVIDPLAPTLSGTLLAFPANQDSIDVYYEGELLFTLYTKKLSELFSSSSLPTSIESVFKIESRDIVVEQSFVGGVQRKRARTRAVLKDSQRYYYNDPIKGLVRANPTKITQQWFQVQKDKYSLLKGWEVQGQYIYSLPFLDEPIYNSRGEISGYNRSDNYDILQVESYNNEFFQTRDNRIVAYKVYRPSVGIFSIYPIKMFDTDTIFSDYSYTPTPEIFRYYTEENMVSEVLYNELINTPLSPLSSGAKTFDPKVTEYKFIKELAIFENWKLIVNVNVGVLSDVDISLEGYDGNTKTWSDLERVVIRNFSNNDSFIFNTYFPVYFYDNTEIPNDDLTPPNKGPQYTMVGLRNYDKKTFDLEKNIFTKARVKINSITNSGNEIPAVITLENNCYIDDPDIKLFNGFAGLQDFTTEQDEAYIQELRAKNDPERFTYQLLLSEYDRLRENFTKEWAVKSKVVPYIQKWVQEGTDARDNYYRLNNSAAFGITNFSPDLDVSFTEPLLLTHEFPYLDAFPKDYPDESVENSRLYFFDKLRDRVFDYELNILEDTTQTFKNGVAINYQDYKSDGYEKNYFYIEIKAQADPILTTQFQYIIDVWKYVDLNSYKTTGVYMGQYVIDSNVNYVFEDLEYKIDLRNCQTSGSILFSVQSSDPRTWYDVLKTDKTDDWFTKYFALGCPTELLPVNVKVPKNREERYTFFNFNTGLGRSQSLFHGAKVQVLDVDSNTLIETKDSNKFIDYKFSAVAQVVRKTNLVTDLNVNYDDNGKPVSVDGDATPFNIEVIKNDLHKSILMIITIHQNDYRLSSGGSEYAFFYAAVNELKNQMQAQGSTENTIENPLTNYIAAPTNYPYQLSNMVSESYYLPNVNYANEPYANWIFPAIPGLPLGSGDPFDFWYQTSRLRNGFMGGGYLEMGDPKIRSVANVVESVLPATPLLKLRVETTEIKPGYSIPLYDDLFTLSNIIPNYRDPLSPSRLFGSSISFNTIKKNDVINEYFKYGFYNRIFATAYTISPTPYLSYHQIVAQPKLDQNATIDYKSITFDNAYNFVNRIPITLTSRLVYPTPFPSLPVSDGTRGNPYTASASQYPNNGFTPYLGETFHLYGGGEVIANKKLEYTFAQIAKLINSDDTILIDYYEVTETNVGKTNSYKLRFVAFDRIQKVSKFYFADDNDKPAEYADVANIGRDFIFTNENETIFRHRGFYEPKSNEILSFWVREDELFTTHFKKDYVLKNTRINNLSAISVLIRNMSYNKVADSEVLKISQGSSYKSLYPFIDEVSIDKGNQLAILSTWDDKYYRKYTSTKDFTLVPGIEDMKEFKSFLASKIMNVPKSYDIQEFNSDEVTYEIIEPGTSIGVAQLGKTDAIGDATKQIKQDGNKPKLVITLDFEKRLLRHMKEDLLNPDNEDEFLRLLSLSPVELNTLTAAEIDTMKTEYFKENIIPLYEVGELNLWLNTNEGFPILDNNLSEAAKVSLKYVIDKNCFSKQNKKLQYTITKLLDTKQAEGFSVSVLLKRI